VVEATKPHGGESLHDGWESLLLSHDYVFAFFDGLNRYYVRREDEPLISRLAVPANVFDNFVTYSEHCNIERVHALTYRLSTTEQLGRYSLAMARRLNRLESAVQQIPATLRKLWQGLRFRKSVRST
jgi:hypothetical protein